MAKRNFFLKESELDDVQTIVLRKKIDKSLIVTGCAGSGKSLIALWKAKEIQNQGYSFLYVVYTKVLKSYMEEAIKAIGLDSVCVGYYHQFFKNSYDDNKLFDYIIIDEAQDFSENQIRNMISRAKIAVHLYGDTAQQLYTFRKNDAPISMEDIRYITKYPDVELMFNHRLPKKIARFAQGLLSDDDDDLEARCKKEGNSKPQIYYCDTLEEQLKTIGNIIVNNDMEDVGILFANNDEVDYAYDFFKHKLNIDVEYKNSSENILHFATTLPKLMTYHSSKGLQFENVFMPGCNTNNRDYKNALYVAVTRTYENLYIFHSGDLSPFINKIDPSLYDKKTNKTNSNKNKYINEFIKYSIDDDDIPF